uniref:Uncharacterized protein n=1 Tax=Amphimedon queenslandica TaxID=400682 RepID=A0A1X7U035_AMPQE
MMSPGVVLVSLLSLVLVYSAAGLECRIYVSSSHGINNTSCWTGGVQTPCATIDLAIQGTPTLQYNCSSGILINLSPGTYTLDTTSLLEQQLLRNNVSIIGMRDGSRYEEVSITCLHVSSSSYNWLSINSLIDQKLDQKCYTNLQQNCDDGITCYEVGKCFNDYINAGPVEVTLYAQTLDLININTSRTVNVEVQCIHNENCNLNNTNICEKENPPYKLQCINNIFSGCCTDNTTGEYYTGCESDWGIPMNNLYKYYLSQSWYY